MTIDMLIGGMPRGGTTVAAKFMSLHRDIFCYAGETHLIPFMHAMFGQLPCRDDKIDLVTDFLRQQFATAMIEMPRYSVSQGAHPGNLIFKEKDVDDLVEAIRSYLKAGLCGSELYKSSLATLRELLSKADQRILLGEKTPNNIFAMADYAERDLTKNIVVMREPIGVLRSMKARVEAKDAYSDAFKGDLERSVGMYLEYAMAARQVLDSSAGGLLVRYEDMAQKPGSVVRDMYKLFGREPEEAVIQFVEGKWDSAIANRAPMNYKRLSINASYAALSPLDIWKAFSFTREVREAFGYSDTAMMELGFEVPSEFPDMEIPPKVLPLYGFHQTGWIANPWMKGRGGLVVYLGKGRSYHVILEFKSRFPEQVQSEIVLVVSINHIIRETVKVATGKQSTVLDLTIYSDELIPMGNGGGYVVIDLRSPVAYCQLGHAALGNDAREVSFRLVKWKIEKRELRWRWWRGLKKTLIEKSWK
jgi:hypothetical protein